MTIFIAWWLTLLSTSSPVWAAEITLTANTEVSSEGYFVLDWAADEESQAPVLLQQSSSASFTNPREFNLPPNSSITITGLEDGLYYFRAREPDSPFSEIVSVEVAHHSLQRAFLFFAVGLVLFIILAATIIIGNRNLNVETALKRKESGEGDNVS